MSSIKPTLFIHIGLPKTGTTALQTALSASQKLLLENRIYYPNAFFWGGHHDIARWLKHGSDDTLLINFFDEMKSGCLENACEKVVISSEGFYYPIASEIERDKATCSLEIRKNLLRLRQVIPEDFNVKIVAYLRRQDLALDSNYNQRVKYSHSFTLSPREFLQRTFERFNRDYDFLLDAWAEVFGIGNIIVRVYEKGQLPDGTIVDFLRNVLQIEDDGLIKKVTASSTIENPRLSRDLLEYKRILNKIYSNQPLMRDQLYLDFLQVSQQMEGATKSGNIFTVEERLEILSKYQEGNERVARKFLGREDGRLFYDPLPDKEKDPPYPGLSVEKSIEISWRLHLLEMNRIEKNVDALNAFISQIKGLFGVRVFRKIYRFFKERKASEIYRRIEKSELFDREYYLSTYPVVKETGLDPLQHYLNHGWKEGFNPSRNFNTAEYLLKYPDLASNDLNPLVHYLQNRK
jgi:hypothetical protein